jgi:hypothetical protein
MTNQSVLFILAFSALGGLIFGRRPIPGPYVPQYTKSAQP